MRGATSIYLNTVSNTEFVCIMNPISMWLCNLLTFIGITNQPKLNFYRKFGGTERMSSMLFISYVDSRRFTQKSNPGLSVLRANA